MPGRTLAFLVFAVIFGYFGFVSLAGVPALLARLLFVVFVALMIGAGVMSGAHSCERRAADDNARELRRLRE
jgi:uncharacterized membrane protein YtjA (UPF0391 family)